MYAFTSPHHAATAPRSAVAELGVVRRLNAHPVNEDETIFTQAVQATESLPFTVREHAEAFERVERRILDQSYLDFLREQIALEARGPEWTAILTERLSAISPFLGVPTLFGSIPTPTGFSFIRVDPATRRVIHHEIYDSTENP